MSPRVSAVRSTGADAISAIAVFAAGSRLEGGESSRGSGGAAGGAPSASFGAGTLAVDESEAGVEHELRIDDGAVLGSVGHVRANQQRAREHDRVQRDRDPRCPCRAPIHRPVLPRADRPDRFARASSQRRHERLRRRRRRASLRARASRFRASRANAPFWAPAGCESPTSARIRAPRGTPPGSPR